MTLPVWLNRQPWPLGQFYPEVAAAKAFYETPSRHYHTWQHVVSCVHTMASDPFRTMFDEPTLAFLAFVFHDAIYEPGAADNEVRSAELAMVHLEGAGDLEAADLERIKAMILATADHLAPVARTHDERLVLDIDLSGLANQPAQYVASSNAIRAEFSMYDDATFNAGRALFLRKMLDAPRIYKSDYASRHWELQARQNMLAELDRLAAERI